MTPQLQVLITWALLLCVLVIVTLGILGAVGIVRIGMLNRRADDCGACEREYKDVINDLINRKTKLIHTLAEQRDINQCLLFENREWKREAEAKSTVLARIRDCLQANEEIGLINILDGLESEAGIRTK